MISMAKNDFKLLSKEGETIKVIMSVEITRISPKGVQVMAPDKHLIWLDKAEIDRGNIIIEE